MAGHDVASASLPETVPGEPFWNPSVPMESHVGEHSPENKELPNLGDQEHHVEESQQPVVVGPARTPDADKAAHVEQSPLPSPCRAKEDREAVVTTTPSPPSSNASNTMTTPGSEQTMPDGDEIPFDGDSSAPRPEAGKLRISPAAINQRMSRVFQPSKRTGEFKVSEQILAMYRSKNGKSKLQSIFQSCGYDVDPGI